MDVTHKTATDALICGEVTDGLFSLADAQYLICQDTAANAALNLQSTSYTLTVSGSPTFTANSGYVGGSTANIDTGFNLSTSGGQMAQNSASVFFWTLTTFTSGVNYGAAIGQNVASPGIDVFPHFSDSNFYLHLTATTSPAACALTGHFYGGIRTSSSASTPWVDITSCGTGSDVSTVPINSNVILLNDGVGGSNARPLTGNMAYAWLGAGMNSTQQGNLYARVHTYMQTICGAP
jgi:hypothetical protein